MEQRHVTFCKPNNTGFTPIYDPHPSRTFVSVNAGDYALYVGGGSINLAFARAFQASGIDEKDFIDLHSHALDLATKSAKGCQVDQPERFVKSVTFCYARTIPGLDLKGKDAALGFSVLDIVEPTDTGVFHDPKNCAMLYVVGPKGSASDLSTFLKHVELTGENLMNCVTEANALLGDRASRKLMRVCAISSGVYKHREASKFQVAQSLIRGMEKAFVPGLSPDIEFAYDEDAFQRAWNARV